MISEPVSRAGHCTWSFYSFSSLSSGGLMGLCRNPWSRKWDGQRCCRGKGANTSTAIQRFGSLGLEDHKLKARQSEKQNETFSKKKKKKVWGQGH